MEETIDVSSNWKKNEKSSKTKKWLIAIIVILLIIVAIFITRAIINHNNDKVSNDPNVSQNYKKKLKIKTTTLIDKLIQPKAI